MTVEQLKTGSSAQILSDYLLRTHRRRTPERYMVLASAAEMPGHFTVEELSERLDSDGNRVATATIYSSLQILVDCGLLRRLRFDDGATRFEMMPSDHHHLICTRCGKIKDVRDNELGSMLRARRYSTFTPSYYTITVYGICSTCARKARRGTADKKTTSKNAISKTKK